jgi:hypothetical protein
VTLEKFLSFFLYWVLTEFKAPEQGIKCKGDSVCELLTSVASNDFEFVDVRTVHCVVEVNVEEVGFLK